MSRNRIAINFRKATERGSLGDAAPFEAGGKCLRPEGGAKMTFLSHSEVKAGKGFLFRVTRFALVDSYNGTILLLAAQDDFVQNVRRLQFNGLVLAILVGAGFIPLV